MTPFENLSEELFRSHIKEAENVFLPDGFQFDKDVVSFIKCFDSVDVDACPGSGKTTALLAKLYIMSKYMPFDNNRGICVLTHTNVAIDEVKDRMGTSSSVLFSYPNFFGTIQSFVDNFLAIPAFISIYENRDIIVDDDVYGIRFNKSVLQAISKDKKFWKNGYVYNLLSEKERNLDFGEQILPKLIVMLGFHPEWGWENGLKLTFRNHIKGASLINDSAPAYKFIDNLVMNTVNTGVIRYSDAFSLGRYYLARYPQIRQAISKRFKYLFIDEVQDNCEYQDSLISSLFNSDTIIQKIGDQNQAIYGGGTDNDDLCKASDDRINFRSSKRISTQIAKVIEPLRIVSKVELKGVNRGTDRLLSPVLLLYDDDTQSKVLIKFCELIKDRRGLWEDDLKEICRAPTYYAVGWRHENEGKTVKRLEKTTIKSYFPEYEKPEKMRSQKYDSLKNYIVAPRGCAGTPKSISDSLLNGFLRVLELGECYNDGRRYTKRSLFDYFQDYGEFRSEFLANLALWTRLIAKQSNDDTEQACFDIVFNQVSKYLKDSWMPHFGISQLIIDDFINKPIEQSEVESKSDNVFSAHDVNVNVGTVHSVKGQTHTATLFLECFCHSFNGEQLLDYMTGEKTFVEGKGVKHKKSALKIAYVAMSRPTHFLCAAFHKDRIPSKTHDKLRAMGWSIVSL